LGQKQLCFVYGKVEMVIKQVIKYIPFSDIILVAAARDLLNEETWSKPVWV